MPALLTPLWTTIVAAQPCLAMAASCMQDAAAPICAASYTTLVVLARQLACQTTTVAASRGVNVAGKICVASNSALVVMQILLLLTLLTTVVVVILKLVAAQMNVVLKARVVVLACSLATHLTTFVVKARTFVVEAAVVFQNNAATMGR